MKQLMLLFAFLILCSSFRTAEKVAVWVVGKESRISIIGSSNVNTFAFDVKQYSGRDTLVALASSKMGLQFRRGILRLPVTDFKNGNPMLTRDFRKMIKAGSHPDIIMNFRNLAAVPAEGAPAQRIMAEVEIILAGRSKIFQFPLMASRAGNTIRVKGVEKVAFTDFGLQAPDKIMGFITVNNNLDVKFELALKVVS
jgi:hypothetical protein